MWMCKLDSILDVMLRWASNGKSSYQPAQFDQWMPSDYAGEEKARKPKNDLMNQLQTLARMFKR